MPYFEDLLTLAFESKGYHVARSEHAPFVLVGDGEGVLVHWRAGAPVGEADVAALKGIVDGSDADRAILLALDGVQNGAASAAHGTPVDVWPTERLAAELMSVVLGDVAPGCTLPDAPAAATAGPVAPAPQAAPATRPAANIYEAASRLSGMQGLAGFSAPVEAPAPEAPRVTATPTQAAQGQTRGLRSKFPSLIAQAASTSPTAGDAAMLLPSRPQPGATASKAVRPNSLPYAWSASAASAAAPTHKGVAHIMDGRRRRQPAGVIDAEAGDAEFLPNRSAPAPRAAPARAAAPVADGDEPAFELYDSKKGSWSELDHHGNESRAAPAPVEAAPAPAVEAPRPADAWAERTTAQSEWTHPAPEGALRPNYTREQALEAVHKRTGEAREVALELVPHYAYGYNLNVQRRELKTPLQAQGRLLVNALTGEVLDAPEKVETTDRLPVATSPHRPAVGAGQAEATAVKNLTQRHTRTIKAHRTIAGVDMTETVHVRPERQELGLKDNGLVYLPIWTIRGEYADLHLDATTGHILHEKIDTNHDVELV